MKDVWGLSDAEPCILLRNKYKGTPHQLITSRQGKRAAGIGSRTYAQERAEVIKDLDTAGVPKSKQAEILGAADAYFKKVRDNIKDPATRDAIFGDRGK